MHVLCTTTTPKTILGHAVKKQYLYAFFGCSIKAQILDNSQSLQITAQYVCEKNAEKPKRFRINIGHHSRTYCYFRVCKWRTDTIWVWASSILGNSFEWFFLVSTLTVPYRQWFFFFNIFHRTVRFKWFFSGIDMSISSVNTNWILNWIKQKQNVPYSIVFISYFIDSSHSTPRKMEKLQWTKGILAHCF